MLSLRKLGVDVTVCLSRAGVEVARMYGVLDDLKAYEVPIVSETSSSGVEIAGEVATAKYLAVVIAPATSNTVAKILSGVADTLPTIAASQALKNGVPLLLLPSDYDRRSLTTFPCIVHSELCTACGTCAAACPHSAIVLEAKARIRYEVCRGCGICAVLCPSNAIECWRKGFYTCFSRDIDNVDNLRKLGVIIVRSVEDAVSYLREIASKRGQPSPASSSP